MPDTNIANIWVADRYYCGDLQERVICVNEYEAKQRADAMTCHPDFNDPDLAHSLAQQIEMRYLRQEQDEQGEWVLPDEYRRAVEDAAMLDDWRADALRDYNADIERGLRRW